MFVCNPMPRRAIKHRCLTVFCHNCEVIQLLLHVQTVLAKKSQMMQPFVWTIMFHFFSSIFSHILSMRALWCGTWSTSQIESGRGFGNLFTITIEQNGIGLMLLNRWARKCLTISYTRVNKDCFALEGSHNVTRLRSQNKKGALANDWLERRKTMYIFESVQPCAWWPCVTRSCFSVMHGSVLRIWLWPLKYDARSGVLIGAGGTCWSDWPECV